jgi:molecular chaperone GrpE
MEKDNNDIKDELKEVENEKESDQIINDKKNSSEDSKEKEINLNECLELIKSLRADLEKNEKEKQDAMLLLQRIQADFDNFRRRSRKEKEEIINSATANLVENLLPILDNFQRALNAEKKESEDDLFYKGVEMIFTGLYQVLEKEGLKTVEAVGCQFNPSCHEAVMQIEANEEYPENIVVEEMQKGYIFNDKVLRPSMVKIAK